MYISQLAQCRPRLALERALEKRVNLEGDSQLFGDDDSCLLANNTSSSTRVGTDIARADGKIYEEVFRKVSPKSVFT